MKKVLSLILLTVFLFISCSKSDPNVIVVEKLPMNAKKVNSTFENGAYEFLGFFTEPTKPRHGESFKIVSFWKFNKEIPSDHKMFFHFTDADDKQLFVTDRFLNDGRVKKFPVGKIIRDDMNINELPRWFDSSELHIKTGFFKGQKRMKVDSKFDDGKSRISFPVIKITKPSIVKKKIDVFAIAGSSRKKIKMDGVLKESFWKNAQTGGKFWTTNGKDIAKNQTNVLVAMDDKNLYVAFEVKDEYIYSTYKKDDDPIYNQDVVEIFIDADGDKDEYYELQVSPANIKFDCSFKGGPRRNKDLSWNSNMKFGVKLDGTLNNNKDKDRGWTVEMAIPFESIKDAPNIPPKDGDKWKVYFYRIEKTGTKKGAEYTAWVPPYRGDFHYLNFMGDMHFIYQQIK